MAAHLFIQQRPSTAAGLSYGEARTARLLIAESLKLNYHETTAATRAKRALEAGERVFSPLIYGWFNFFLSPAGVAVGWRCRATKA
ncbi:hypothetical protein [Sodalis sp. (in: enterobacteria)]|uniref:hypothetical protein n=1 Tax=Sodalis sp. (in: enterobacteria) TaxID=1898979 RepID=UPI003F2A7B12